MENIVYIKLCFSYFSIIDRPELVSTGGNIRKPIMYNERLHRHMYLPWGKPVEVFFFTFCFPDKEEIN